MHNRSSLTPNSGNDAFERSSLVYAFHERLYRLALLVVGRSDTAATLVEQAFRQLEPATPDPEVSLLRALFPKRSLSRWRWSPEATAVERSSLSGEKAQSLLALLGRLTPLARLIIGLHYISGHSSAEIAQLLEPEGGESAVVDLLMRFRVDAAQALERVPKDTEDATLTRIDRWMEGALDAEDTQTLRRELFEQPELRAVRDGLSATRELLPRAVPALFSETPPLQLTERLLQAGETAPPKLPIAPRARRAQLWLAVGVLVAAIAIILVPSFLARRGAATAGRVPTASELLENALHRFDSAGITQGVLHEQYQIDSAEDASYVVERWYDYASPMRLAIDVRRDGERSRPILQIGSDGRSLVQFRYDRQRGSWGQAIDAHTTEAEAQAVLPLLRSQPALSTFTNSSDQPAADPGPSYLAQARSARASFLGQTSMLGRPAYLLTYRTDKLPEHVPAQTTSGAMQIILTIDAQTYSLMDVAVLPEGAAEGTARHLVQARQVEVLDSVPESRFYLASSPGVQQQSGVASIRFPFIALDQFVSLDEAARRAPGSLLAPQQLPDPRMRGLAVTVDNNTTSQIALLYEGEFENVLVFQDQPNGTQLQGEEFSAGAFRYRLVDNVDFQDSVSAIVYPADKPDQRLVVILNADLATSDERAVALQSLIASLTPVDDQTLPALRGSFRPPSSSAGGN